MTTDDDENDDANDGVDDVAYAVRCLFATCRHTRNSLRRTIRGARECCMKTFSVGTSLSLALIITDWFLAPVSGIVQATQATTPATKSTHERTTFSIFDWWWWSD